MKKIFLTSILLISALITNITTSASNVEQTIPNTINPTLEMSDSLQGFESFTNVVIFIRFADETSYNAPYGASYYEDLFNRVGDGIISVRDYYLEASYGQQDIYSELIFDENNQILFYTDIYNRNYYEPYSSSNPDGYDESSYDDQALREHRLLGRAIKFVEDNNLIDDSINLDVNNDGDIDALTFLVSGEDNGWSSLLWPHQWYMYTDYNEVDAPSINGAKAYTYTFNLLGDSIFYDVKTSVGILAHETFHLLGAPDLYHYYTHFYLENAGPWSLMDNNVEIPPHMLGYMKYAYGGWIDDVTTITESGTYSLSPMMDSADNLLRIDTGYSNEYVYLEYRVQEGVYESTLPQQGLLVYRVDEDYYGNESGYSETDTGEGINEVFMFRPGIKDTVEPITFPLDSDDYDYGGDLYQAALSDTNPHGEAGVDSDFILFHSDGTMMNISITNVTENNGEITFDLTIEANKNINVKFQIDGYDMTPNELLFDHESLIYEGTLTGVDAYDVYVSLDGDEATTSDALYDGSILFNSANELIHIAIYDADTLLDTKVFDPVFVDRIETDHDPYGDNVYLSWFIPAMDNFGLIELTFDAFFETEADYDFFYISYNNDTVGYDGTSLRNEVIDLTDQTTGVWLEFISDEYLSDYYGVYADIVFEFEKDLTVEEAVRLNGEDVVDVIYGQTFDDPGLIFEFGYEEKYDITVSGVVDTNTSGTYTLTYDIYFEDELVYTLTRDVIVGDMRTVSFDGIDDFNVELGSSPMDLETLITNPVYNGNDYTIDITGNINYDELGSYELVFTLSDNFMQSSSQSVTVNVIDTTAPDMTLNMSIDTISLGQLYIDQGVIATDLTTVSVDVTNDLNTNEIGVYTFVYTATDSSGNVTEMMRMVHVIEPQHMNLIIDRMLTTIEVGTIFSPPSCQAKIGNITYACDTTMNQTNMGSPGNYPITYSFEYRGVTYEKVWYVFVIEREEEAMPVAWLPKKEGEWR